MSVMWITKLRLTIMAFLVHKARCYLELFFMLASSQAPPKLFSHIIYLIFHTICNWKAGEELGSTVLVERGLGARWAETNALHGTLLLCPPICAVCN